MPNEESINEIVSPKAISQVEVDLVKALEKSNLALQDNIKSVATLNDAIANSKGFASYNAKTAAAASAQERVQKTIAQRQLTEEKLAAFQAAEASRESARNIKRIADEQKLAALREKKRKTIISDSAAEVAAYEKSKQGIEGVTNTVNRLNEAEGRAANSAIAGAGKIQAANKGVAQTQSTVETVTNNVGKAAERSGNIFTQLYSKIRLAAAIIPGLGIQGIFALGFTGVYELIKAFDTYIPKVKDAALVSKELGAAVASDEFKTAVSNVSDLRINIDLAKKGFLDKDRVVKQYNETIGKTTGFVTNLNQAEAALNKNANAYIQFTLLKSAANAALNESALKAVEAQKAALAPTSASQLNADSDVSILDRLKVAFSQTDDALVASKNKRVKTATEQKDQLLKIAEDFRKQAAKIAFDNGFNFFEDKQEKTKTTKPKVEKDNSLEQLRKDSIEIINNDKASFQERLGALESFLSVSNQLYKNKEGERSKALIDYKNYEKKINDDANKAILDQFTKDEQERIRVLQQSNSNELEINEQKRSAVALALDSQYADGIISKEEYDAKIYQLDKKASMDAIKLQLDTLDAILEIQRQDLFNGIGSEDEYTANLKKQAELRVKYSKIEVDAKIKAREDSAKAAEKELDAIKQLTAKSLEFGKALIDGIYTRRLNALADESAALNKKKQQDIENVNDSVLTEQQKADQIAIINARADAQQTVIDEKIRQQKIKQAKADKAQAIAQIIIQTALAQVKVIGQAGLLGFVFSPLITALGALSLATALATPIPQFEKGGTTKHDGHIITGEAGTELRINPDGSQELTASQANLSYAKAGTKIIPNHELVRMMAKPDQIQYVGGQSVDINALIAEQKNTTKVLKKAFGDQSVHSTIVTKNGWFANNTKMARVKKHINRNFS